MSWNVQIGIECPDLRPDANLWNLDGRFQVGNKNISTNGTPSDSWQCGAKSRGRCCMRPNGLWVIIKAASDSRRVLDFCVVVRRSKWPRWRPPRWWWWWFIPAGMISVTEPVHSVAAAKETRSRKITDDDSDRLIRRRPWRRQQWRRRRRWRRR